MVDLFRYIEHDFAVPVATDAIDVTNQSEFQTALDDAVQGGQQAEGQGAAEPVRALAEEFLASHFESPTDDPTALGHALDALAGALRRLTHCHHRHSTSRRPRRLRQDGQAGSQQRRLHRRPGVAPELGARGQARHRL